MRSTILRVQRDKLKFKRLSAGVLLLRRWREIDAGLGDRQAGDMERALLNGALKTHVNIRFCSHAGILMIQGVGFSFADMTLKFSLSCPNLHWSAAQRQ